MTQNQYHLLKSRRFLPLFVTQFFNAFNDNVFKNALIILITYKIAKNAQAQQYMIAIISGIFILPFFLFSATAGQLADKFEKSNLIRIIKFFEIIFMIVASLGFYWNNLFLLMSTLFFLGIHSTFFGPLKYSVLPEHLHKNELIGGNALIEAGTFIAILIGQILGGSLVLLRQGAWGVSISMISIALVGFLSSFLIPKTRRGQPDLKISFNIVKETWRIINISREKRDVYLAILGISWFWFIGATFLTKFPTFIKETLHSKASVFTLFLTVFSLGIGIGSMLCNRLLKGQITAKYVPIAILGMSVFIFDVYLAANNLEIPTAHLLSLQDYFLSLTNIRILLDVLFMTICGGLFIVPLYALIQDRTKEAQRSRVIAGNNIINAFFMVLSAIFSMSLTLMHFTTVQLFLCLAVGNLFVAIFICKLLPDAIVQSFLKWILQLCYHVEVKNLDYYQSAGKRLIIIANHTSFLDAALLAAFLPGKLTFAVNTQIAEKWWLRAISKITHTISLDPTNPLAIKKLIKAVRENRQVVIFPEGRITITGSLMKIYEGPGLIADQAQAPVLPIRIDGAQYTPFSRLKKKVNIRWFPKITLTILQPQIFQTDENIKGRARRQRVGRELYDIMSNMMFASSYCQKTLFESLLEAKKIHSGKHLILEDIERKPINYRQLIKFCFVLGTHWQKILSTKTNVGIILPNIIANVINFFALQSIGKTPTMLNYTFGSQDLLLACQTTGIQDVITSKRFITLGKLQKVIETFKEQKIRVHFIEQLPTEISFSTKLIGLTKNWFPWFFYKQWATNPLNPAVILFTSGSEGTPKGVVLSHQNIQANRFQLSARIDFTAQDIIFNALPMFHSFGLNSGTILPILFGVRTFLYPSPLHYRIIPECIYEINATITLATDTFLQGYGKFASPYDFYSVRYVLAGAEKLKDETQALWMQKFGLRILEGYGATETSPVISMNTPMHYKSHTVGRFIPGIDYRLEPVDGITHGGRLFVKGPNIMLGYMLKDQPETIIPPLNQWYDTGDIVSVNEEGYIKILGRAKRFAKIAGEMISLTAIEQFLASVWPNMQHAVIGMPDPQKGEQIILITTFAAANREELLLEAKKRHMAEIQIPKKIIHIEKMPLLGTGKIDYKALDIYIATT